MQDGNSGHDVPFMERTDPSWIEIVKTWKWKQVRINEDPQYDYYLIQGDCPRCGHSMHRELKVGQGMGFLARKLPATITVKCNCDHLHEPEKLGSGCGEYGPIPFAHNIE